MRQRTPLLLCSLLCLCFLSSCKKAEQPPVNSKTDQPATTPVAPENGAKPATPATSGKGVVLKAKWVVGNRYVYRMDLDQNSTNHIPQMPQPMRQSVTMAMTYALNVVKETPTGGREVEMEFLANEMEIKMAEQVVLSFDSKENAKDEAKNPFLGPFRKMIGSKLRMEFDADGKVDKIVGMDEWMNQVAGEDGGPGRGILSQQFNEAYFKQIADFGRAFPAKPVEVGDTWPFKMDVDAGPAGKLSIDSTFIFKDWEERDSHKCAMLEVLGTMKGGPAAAAGPMGKMSIENGKLAGTTWFDPELGALVESSANQSLNMKGEIPTPPGTQSKGAQFTSEIAQKINVKLVELTKGK